MSLAISSVVQRRKVGSGMCSSKLLSQRRKREIQERFQWPGPKKGPAQKKWIRRAKCERSLETGGRTWNIDPGSVRKVSWSNLIYTGKMPRTACGWQKLRRANRLIMSTSARTIRAMYGSLGDSVGSRINRLLDFHCQVLGGSN